MKAPRYLFVIFLAVLLVAAGGVGWHYFRQRSSATATGAAPLAEFAQVRHAVRINPGPATPKVVTAALNRAGAPVPVACSTCHTTRPPQVATRSAGALREFHQGLVFRHGQLSCLSCHNATNYDTLRRADGTEVAFPRVIELCAQCHGPQYRDYQAGAHGGMTGYWDLSRGPRTRNLCTDCHDPHAPAYPQVRPVFAPRDRGARQQAQRESAPHSPTAAHE